MSVVNYKSIYTPTNAKLIKRLAAYMIDIITIIILFTGVLFVLSEIFNYMELSNQLEQLYIELGVKVADSEGKYDFCDVKNDTCKQALKVLYEHEKFYPIFNSVQNFLIYAPIGSIFVSLLVFELIMPLIFKNGQTIGMKLFNIALLSKNHIRVKPIQIFVRFLFGKFIINGIIPVIGVMYIFVSEGAGMTGAMLLLLFIIANVACYGIGQNKTLIPDALSGCFPIDLQEQIFFDTEDELIAAKAEEHRRYIKTK